MEHLANVNVQTIVLDFPLGVNLVWFLRVEFILLVKAKVVGYRRRSGPSTHTPILYSVQH